MKRLLLVASLLACTRPPPPPAQPRGVQLDQVTLTTWRGADASAHGTARRATLTVDGFVADDVELTTASGATVRAPAVAGEIDLHRVGATSGLQVATLEGCAGSTAERVDYLDGVATTTGSISAKGCGFELEGKKLTYRVAERRAEVDGPVRTRVEAR